jgi:hypothetical protein
MCSVLSLKRGEYSVVWLPTSPSVDAATLPADDLKNDPVPSNGALPSREDPYAISRFLLAFCIGITATLAWQSCGDAARRLAQASSLKSGGSAPIAQPTPNVIAPETFASRFLSDQHLAALQEDVDRLAVTPQQINIGIVQLPFVREQMTRNISQHQTARHTALNASVPLPRPAPAETPNHAPRPATTAGAAPNAHHTVTAFTGVMASSSPSPALSSRLDAGQKRTRSSATMTSSAPEPFGGSLIFVGQSVISVLSKITGIQL